MSKITNVYWFENNQVMVFDENGKQMPEYQGNYEEVAEKIKAAGYVMPTTKRKWSMA